MSTTSSSDDLFQEAARAFRASLSPCDSKEFTEFPSAKEMIKELNKRISSYQKKSKMLASNFSSFLDKLLVMFEKIGDRLPGYADYYRRLMDRKASRKTDLGSPKFESTRVLKVLSYIYKDLMQFCQEACQVFGTKKRGIRYKAAAIADIFWKPFDVRFKNILERIETHQALFLSEMQLEESRFTESQFRKRQQDSDNTDAAIAEINLRLSQLRETIMHQEQAVAVRFDNISKSFASEERDRERGEFNEGSGPQKKSPLFDTDFRLIAKWINASDFSRELNKAHEAKLDDTGEWFLASPCYNAFKALETGPLESGSELPKLQIMLVQAKPGYGKTILSSTLIDDLAKPPETGRPGGPKTPPTLPVLYYHFASDKVEECSPTHGLRACLHQTIHRNTKAADILDAVSIITEADETGQIKATDEDIRQCLLLLLTLQTPVTMVFDGLDECTNPPDLFRTVYELCCRTGAKAVFLGRPSCKPPRGCNSYTVVNLDPAQNVDDIRSYLQPEIADLKNDNLLPRSSNVEEIATFLARRAQGMFLWARLVVHYLSHDWLSPSERMDAVYDDTMLDGLENLYGKIIKTLEQGHPAQQEKVHRIFQVMATRRSPFTLIELRQIVAVKLGQVTREEDLIVNFQDCLPVMCGALVECDSSGHVRFIHSSFREYISKHKYLHDSPLAVTKQSSWLTLTTICLSYLTYDIPRAAITTTESSDSQRKMIATYFPLLQYGIARVQEHDYGIFHRDIPTSKDELDRGRGVLKALEEWIDQRLCVTAWIEANFFFQQLPALEPLITMTEMWRVRYEAHRAQAEKILSLCRRLEQDLAALRNEWAPFLFNEPSAIWSSTITVFTKSSFWETQNNTIITHLGEQLPSTLNSNSRENRASHKILIKSQTAADKMTHATIYAIPSRQYVNIVRQTNDTAYEISTPLSSMNSHQFHHFCSGWKAQYQIQDISSELVVFSITVDIPTADVLDILEELEKSYLHLCPCIDCPERKPYPKLWRLKFPVAISADLDLVLILHTLVSLRLGTAKQGEKQLGSYAVCSRQLHNDLESIPHYESMLSPMGDAIAFFDTSMTSTVSWTLDIWSRETSLPQEIANQYIFRGRLKITTTQYATFGGKLFLFHPCRPCLAYVEWGAASIWCYNEPEGPRKFHQFMQSTIIIVSFWSDIFIRYVSWTYLDKDGYEVVEAQSVNGAMPERCIETVMVPVLCGFPHVYEGSYQGSSPYTSDDTSITKRQSAMMTVTNRGEPFGIVQDGQANQVVKITSVDGRMAQFGHIPSLPSWVPSSLTLLPINGSVKVLWDKELQKTYSVIETPSPYLTCIIERTFQSVRLLDQAHSESSRISITTDSDAHFGESQLTKKRPRIGDDNAGEEPKKRAIMTTANIIDRDDIKS